MKFFHFLFTVLLMIAAYFLVDYMIEKLREEAIKNASDRLSLTRDIRIAQLKNEVKTMYSEVRFWAESKPLSEGMEQILIAWNELGINPKEKARQLYITDNPLYPNYTADFYKADDGSSYSDSHQTLHKLIKGLTQQRGYYDVFLIANNGDVVYSVFKQDDFATNLISGKYKKSSLAHGFKEVQENTNLNHVSLTDFLVYKPSHSVPASFIQTSIVNKKNKTIGMLALQLPMDPLNKIITNSSGLVEGTEILAVGADSLMRNRIDNKIQKVAVHSDAIKLGLEGKTGVGTSVDYKGVKTITAYAPFGFSQNILGDTANNTWAIVAKQNLSDVLAPVEENIKNGLIFLLVLTLFSLFFAWLVVSKKQDLSITED